MAAGDAAAHSWEERDTGVQEVNSDTELCLAVIFNSITNQKQGIKCLRQVWEQVKFTTQPPISTNKNGTLDITLGTVVKPQNENVDLHSC